MNKTIFRQIAIGVNRTIFRQTAIGVNKTIFRQIAIGVNKTITGRLLSKYEKKRITMTDYRLLEEQIKGLAEISGDMVSLMSNASALLYEALSDVNWAGFYIVRNDLTDKIDDNSKHQPSDHPTSKPSTSEQVLLVGPFQGKVACVRIEKGKGVCGTAWAEDKTQLVPDVHKFPGHIACDSASNSEIVIPIHHDGEVVAVLDIDSPLLGRFTEDDKAGLEGFVRVLEDCTVFA